MKKTFTSIIFFVTFGLFWIPQAVHAGAAERIGQIMAGIKIHGEGAFAANENQASRNNPLWIARNTAILFLSFVGILVLIAFLYGGWLWMTSQGNEEKLAKARRVLFQAVIGAFMVLASLAITYFVIDVYAAVTDNRYWRGGNIYYDLPTPNWNF